MRRALLAVIAGGTLLAGAACDSDAPDASDTAAAPAPATTGAAPATTSAAPATSAATPGPDSLDDTKRVCDRVRTVYQDELRDFGAAMGKMITYKEAKDTDQAKKAEAAAAAELKAVALRIRKETAVALDPQIKTAGAQTAAKLEAGAKDRRYIAKVKTMKDLNGTIEGQLNQWLSPVSGYCTV